MQPHQNDLDGISRTIYLYIQTELCEGCPLDYYLKNISEKVNEFIRKTLAQSEIQELEKALQNPNNGTPTYRVIARHTLKVLKQKPLMDLDKQNF